MSLLPTAHAGQSFGARRIDFYTVSGEVSASDDGTGRVTDTDGMAHDVRLLERSNALAPGDTASVLRVQAGPNRRSRPAAIINHTRGTWMRAAPDATGLLARSGVTRGFNWWLSTLALALVAIAAVWPAIHGFLTEVNGNLMTSIPAFDVYAEIAAILPGLSGWRLETALPSGLLDGLASLGFIPMEQLTEWGLGVGAGLLALLSFLGRSWRLVYIPALAALALATGSILGAALPTLAVIGGSLLLFTLGGLINRIRDGGRFNARVARLAEHALRNPPQEGVRASDASGAAQAGVTASAAIAAATAAAEGNDEVASTEDAATDDAQPDDSVTSDAVQAEDGSGEAEDGSGEAEAPAQDDLLPAAPTSETETDIAADAAEPEAAGEVEAIHDAADAAEASDVIAADERAVEPAAEADLPAEAEVAVEPEVEAADATGEETPAEQAETELATADAAPADAELDDDLPSLDDVAAAAALTAVETSAPEGDDTARANASQPAVDLDDERTMPVAPPPPMPGDDAIEAAAEADAETEASPEVMPDAEPTASADLIPEAAPEPVAAEAVAEASEAPPASIVDDPLMDEDTDPMVSSEGKSDYAPGAPEIDLDRAPVS